MSDTLEIFGKTYNNVAGIIATDTNAVDITFINMPPVTVDNHRLIIPEGLIEVQGE